MCRRLEESINFLPRLELWLGLGLESVVKIRLGVRVWFNAKHQLPSLYVNASAILLFLVCYWTFLVDGHLRAEWLLRRSSGARIVCQTAGKKVSQYRRGRQHHHGRSSLESVDAYPAAATTKNQHTASAVLEDNRLPAKVRRLLRDRVADEVPPSQGHVAHERTLLYTEG